MLEVAAVLDRLGVEYLLGGSLASSMLGEPRTTVDIDLALTLPPGALGGLVRSLDPAFFVDPEAAAEAVRRRSHFNVLHRETMLKVDFFLLGDSAFDREQLRRRLRVPISPDSDRLVAVSSAEDLVRRKLAWYRAGGGVSDRQWRDVLTASCAVQRHRTDIEYLRRWSAALGVEDLVERALVESGPSV